MIHVLTGFIVVALASAGIGSLVTYVLDELRHERQEHPRVTSHPL